MALTRKKFDNCKNKGESFQCMQKTVTGLRLDAKLEVKLARAVEMSGWPKADVLRLALSRGLDDLEAIDYDTNLFCVRERFSLLQRIRGVL